MVSTSCSRPKQVLGGGGDSPGGFLWRCKVSNYKFSQPLTWFESGPRVGSVFICRCTEVCTHRLVLVGATLLTRQRAAMDIQKHHIVVDQQLGLKRDPQRLLNGIDLTYFEDAKNPVEILAPSHDRIFVGFCMGEPRNRTSFILADNLLLNLGNSPAIENLLSGIAQRARCWFNLPSQFLNGPEDGWADILRLPPVQPPVQGSTNGTASQSEVNVIMIVRRGVLDGRESEVGPSIGTTNL